MATPNYTALVGKVRDWSNKPEIATIADSVLGDCLSYAADEAYRVLRIPPLEHTVLYTVVAGDNLDEQGLTSKYTTIRIPEDLTEFVYVRTVPSTAAGCYTIYNEITDARTFLDEYAEKYSFNNFMWKGNYIYLKQQLKVGDQVELHYYRRLPALDATFAVVPVNYVIGLSDALQPYLSLTGVVTDTPLYFSTAGGVTKAFATLSEAQAYNPTVTTKYYVGLESPNWLKDENERILMFGALSHLGGYLFDDKMEVRYKTKFDEILFSINKEEKFRRARGGNVQMNLNGNGLI